LQFSDVLNYETGRLPSYKNVELNPHGNYMLISNLVETNWAAVRVRSCIRFVDYVDFRID